MTSSPYSQLEVIADELMRVFEIHAPPVPVESMLERPVNGMWEDVNLSQLTGSFLNVRNQYSPRMSIARLLARHVRKSAWGEERNLSQLVVTEDDHRAFARMVIMPNMMIETLSSGARNPVAMSMFFEVPEDEAQDRLLQWAGN